MINQLIEKLEELKKELSSRPHMTHIVSERSIGVGLAIEEAQQLQDKVRCGNCHFWSKLSNEEPGIGYCNKINQGLWNDLLKGKGTYYLFSCKFWEEKE